MLLNVILRILPFWVREPLLIAIALFLGGACVYWFVRIGGWQRAAFAFVFLALAILRVAVLRRELRSRGQQAARTA
ncbi:hypothetical protein [Streptomyces sp. CBMA152]|uniref:hypothetical protein n=1 Tax=Streptomyces sp. CBMA152 TaxID=1896312 RepID=UPI0016614B7C|nr:hypothetical protein [Streptomyces sp. CBMA152]MBD0743090.1 hypothetical protein [Streptomyces sp. CBMA152]